MPPKPIGLEIYAATLPTFTFALHYLCTHPLVFCLFCFFSPTLHNPLQYTVPSVELYVFCFSFKATARTKTLTNTENTTVRMQSDLLQSVQRHVHDDGDHDVRPKHTRQDNKKASAMFHAITDCGNRRQPSVAERSGREGARVAHMIVRHTESAHRKVLLLLCACQGRRWRATWTMYYVLNDIVRGENKKSVVESMLELTTSRMQQGQHYATPSRRSPRRSPELFED